jgi:hypothetical protein
VNIISHEIAMLFALNGMILSSNISISVACPCKFIASTKLIAIPGVVVMAAR